MYRCKNCGCRFDEPKELNSSWEAYYGISGMFDYSTPRTAYVCPECNDDEIEEEYDDEDLENDWEEEDQEC